MDVAIVGRRREDSTRTSPRGRREGEQSVHQGGTHARARGADAPRGADAGAPAGPMRWKRWSGRKAAPSSSSAKARARWRWPSAPARPGRLGVNVQELTPELAAYFGVKDGVLVSAVQADTPAAKAGLKAGDVITSSTTRPSARLRVDRGAPREGRRGDHRRHARQEGDVAEGHDRFRKGPGEARCRRRPAGVASSIAATGRRGRRGVAVRRPRTRGRRRASRPAWRLFHPGAGVGHPRGAQHAAVGSEHMDRLFDGCRIPSGEGLANPIDLPGRVGLEKTYQLADEPGVAVSLPARCSSATTAGSRTSSVGTALRYGLVARRLHRPPELPPPGAADTTAPGVNSDASWAATMVATARTCGVASTPSRSSMAIAPEHPSELIAEPPPRRWPGPRPARRPWLRAISGGRGVVGRGWIMPIRDRASDA